MDTHELVMTAARTVAVYALMLVVIRALGKRTVGNFSAFDLLVALMLGEVVDEMIYGDVLMRQGIVAILTLALLQYANSWLSYSSPKLAAILEGSPTALVRDGRLERDGMRQEHMNEDDVHAELRLQGVEDIAEVKLAMVEPDGTVSVLKKDWAEEAQKRDVGAAAADEETEPELVGAEPGGQKTKALKRD
jgi:uncharacterized membrane protein YcaP (DUF421 family)